ncbi:DNRLRE domain-containing protein [Aeromicrobium sp. 9AM]|uniref:DNRLRE domain-containing protein n=1 Tax=Aeromicrobium sp. 9AM TaxID=2653126 RepID=UPI0012F40B65|nr:DNRLRE domain-containing protein [Aeromicrobium sp. 9AM]VXC09025.1 conserved hypothetical protein [Aeromicrobium sp. 9AM]
MTFTTLALASDALVRENNPTTPYGASSSSSVSGATSARRRSLGYFNLPFPRGVQIISATLTVFQKEAATGGARVIDATPLAAGYQESKVTWDDQPIAAGTVGSSPSQGNSAVIGRPWPIDLTATMQAVADGAPWYGFRLSSTNTTILQLFDRSDPDFAPVVDIEFADAPQAPTELAPSSARSVSIARPTLRFDFSDLTGDTSMAALQVWMNLSAPSVTPSFDSGVVAADLPEYVPTFDVTVGQEWFWQAAVQDGAGLWSDRSEWVSFKRTAKPTVAITAPSTSVFEPTPTLAWTVTGGTQKQYQVFITDPVDTTLVLWDSQKRTSTSTSLTMPKLTPPVLSPGGSYLMVLRVWDTVLREGVPGDPVYTEVTKAFTFGLSGAVTGVSSLVATGGTSPGIPLTWTRATAPDSFSVVRDGVTIATNLDPTDLTTGGTGYAWTDRGATPRHAHTYTVLAVVGGLASQTNPTANATTTPNSLWVVSADGLHAVAIANRDTDTPPIDTVASEVSEVHRPIGARNPVLRTQSVYGRAGSIAGALTVRSSADSLDVQRAHWRAIVANRSTPVYVTAVDTAFRATLYNVPDHIKDDLNDFVDVDCDYFEVR